MGSLLDRGNYAIVCLLWALIISAAMGAVGWAASKETKTDAAPGINFKIGVLARRGNEECLREWSSTAEYLTKQVPGSIFRIIPLGFEAVQSAVKNEAVDFIIVNPAIYVELRSLYHVSGMATIKRKTSAGHSAFFGGTIFCASNRADIDSLEDLKGKSFMAVDETSFGGWLAAWRELKSQGIEPRWHFSELGFAGTHDAVVHAVKAGKVDAGTVASSVLEQMTAEGKIDRDAFKVINRRGLPDYPYELSTRVYPEWPFVKLRHTPDELAERVAVALIEMPAGSPAATAANSSGWTILLDYGSVEACQKDLRVGIYKDFEKITLHEFFETYRGQIYFGFAGVLVLMGLLIFTLELNRRLRISRIELRDEMDGHRRTAEALRESEEKYRSMMEAMDDAAYICSSDYRIEYQNPAMTRLIGREIVGESCYRAIHGLDKKCSWCVHDRVLGGETVRMEINSPRNQRDYHVSNSPLHHPDGSVSKITIFRDITDSKKMAKRFDQTQRIEAIGALAAGIAHDFNNILYPIMGMAEMLMEDFSPSSPHHENAEVIYSAAKRAGALVKQILSFSRQSDHEKMPVRLQHILKEVLKLTRSTIPSNIEINRHVQDDCSLVMADPAQMHQIAMNLITNAYHAVEESGGTITVTLKEAVLSEEEWAGNSLRAGRYAAISVGDTGKGIEPSLMGKIFEPYFTTKEFGKGTGLGLSVVHGIVKDHGGDIRVYSKPGKGSLFTVYLPLLIKSSTMEAGQEVEIMECGTERILVVDDEEPIAYLEQTMLERLGYRVTTRTSSVEALAVFKARPDDFDLVISDMTMPNMTGDRLARELNKIRPDIPVILCTGFSTLLDERAAEAIGVKGVLLKPVVKSEMARKVRAALSGVN